MASILKVSKNLSNHKSHLLGKSISKRLEFHISYNCINNCSFCSEYDRMEQFRKHPVSLSEIKKVLITKRRDGFDFVNFTGGEPTIHPDFLEILRFAKSLGYKIYVGTNGSMIAKSDFCKKAIPFLDELSFSIHGHNAELHDSLVGRKGAFDDIVIAIDNVDRLGFENKFANIVTVKNNFESIDKILEFLGNKKFKQILFSNLAPEGMGLKQYQKLSVRINDWRRKISKLADLSEKYGMSLRFFGLPLCAMGEHKFLSNDLFWDGRVTTERVERFEKISLVDIGGDVPDRNRVKPKVCDRCSHNKICFGVFDEYVRHFGDKELKAFKDGE